MTQAVKRPYKSPRRSQSAQDTRRHILLSARTLFLERGYGGATIEAIARAAAVAPQTVYATFGSKRAILFALLDQMAVDAEFARFQDALAASAGDPQRQLREQIAFNARFYAAGLDLIDIARTVSGTEPDLGAMWREGEARRHRAQAPLVAGWADAGVLASGLDVREAADILWTLTGPDVFRLLVVEQNWEQGRFEDWLAHTLERALFGTGAK